MSERADMIGIKFGKLTPIKVVCKKRIHLKYLCLCECGNEMEAFGYSLRSGNTKSCGCIRRPNLIGYKNKHGVVVEKIKNSVWKLQCNYCNDFHIQNQREIKRESMSMSCGLYRPPNWSGFEKNDYTLRKKYNITLKEFNSLLKLQDGKCAICAKCISKKRKLINIDHDHKTGIVRGLLCTGCNTGLGHLGDNIEGIKVALEYLENTPFSKLRK